MRIPTAEIVVNGRRKIVNAGDPRVKEHAEKTGLSKGQGRQKAVTRKPRAKAAD